MAKFDDIGTHFLKNIHGRTKGRIRMAVLRRDLAPLIDVAQPLHILDAGGGAGHTTCLLLALGHHVTLIDQSQVLLDEAHKQAQAQGLSQRLTLLHGDIAALDRLVGGQSFDGICCHAVLEWLSNDVVKPVLDALYAHLAPKGFLSLMYYNYCALYFIQHVFGNFSYLDQGLVNRHAAKLTPLAPRTQAQVDALLAAYNLAPYGRSGVRCFYDYMKKHDRERHDEAELIRRELILSRDQRYLSVARYIHDLRLRS